MRPLVFSEHHLEANMSQFLAYAGSDPRQVARALTPALEHLEEVVTPYGWGLGYEQESQILLRKGSVGTRPLSLARMGSELRTRAFVGVIEGQKGRVPRTPENTAPFRWKGWLFGALGALPSLKERRAALLEALPDFLVRNLQGDSDAELLFHLFLARLRSHGITLQSLFVPLEATLQALREVLLELEASAGQALEVAVAVSDGRNLVVVDAGVPLMAWRIHGLAQMPGQEHRPEVRRAHRDVQIHAVMVTQAQEGAPQGWQPLPRRTLWAMDGEGAVHQAPLDA